MKRGVVAAALLVGLAGCTVPAPAPGPRPTPVPSPALSRSTAGPASSPPARELPPEPTTTNMLPPPPDPSEPAPTTSGPLTSRSLPVPAGWRTAVLAGGPEDGYQGNGSWVHGRDPRYAAYETIAVGCTDLTRDDYTDPTAALEGTYTRDGQPGVGLVLEFAAEAPAARYRALYEQQLRACTAPDDPFTATVRTGPLGLVDRRSHADGAWTEVVRRDGRRVTLIALSDPGHAMSAAQVDALLTAIGRSSTR